MCLNSEQRELCERYLQGWVTFENLAIKEEEKELNIECNKSWKNVKHDSNNMWNLIDWKGKSEIDKKEKINESTINVYFKGIFQSVKTKNNPRVTDIVESLDIHQIIIPVLDETPDLNELEIAIKTNRRGISFDGLPSNVLHIIPQSLKKIILLSVQNIFFGKYPQVWKSQMQHAITKPAHTYNCPQLRDIAVAPLLCGIYDTIMNNRFGCWYVPNPEQSGFRAKQRCVLPLFTLVIMIIFCKENKRNLFVGFLDFEKAFDYVNRAQLLQYLMVKGRGTQYLHALSKMYMESFYVPKFSETQLGERIRSVHGDAQGRRSSTNYFSFFVSDMPIFLKYLNTNDFLDPYNLIQLADDTWTLAEYYETLRRQKFIAIFLYSKYQVPNVKKMYFAHFSEKPIVTPMLIGEDTYI